MIMEIKHNKSGFAGVTWHKENKKWRAQIRYCKHDYHIGLFVSKDEAIERYKEAEIILFGEKGKQHPGGLERVREHSHYDIDPHTGCWNWKRSLTNMGYARINCGNNSNLAHRYIYEETKGKIPKKMTIDHLCRNRKCINPDHLEVVSLKENIRRGINIKLNKEIVSEFKILFAEKISMREIGRRYKVSHTAVRHAIRGFTWL